MAHAPRLTLVDPHGVPFDPRIEEVVVALSARAQRQFPALRDELLLTEVLEETARRIAQRGGHQPGTQGHAAVLRAVQGTAATPLHRGGRRYPLDVRLHERVQADGREPARPGSDAEPELPL